MEWLMNVYLGCFVFGLIFTVASFLLGGLNHFAGGHDLSVANHGTHGLQTPHTYLQAHHAGHNPAASQETHKETAGWFNLNALVVFLTWFGGAGFILKSVQVADWASAGLALISGLVGYLAVLLFMSKVLISSQTPVMRAADYDLTGIVAQVSSTIFENGVGEVIYSKHGTRRSVAARSISGEAFPPGIEVVILRFENGVAFVDDLNRLLAEAGAEKWSNSGLSRQ